MIQFEETIKINAQPEAILSHLGKSLKLVEWDMDVFLSSIDGKFITSVKDILKPTKGPKVRIEFVEVTKNKSFTTLTKLPLCTMCFEHKLVPIGEVFIRLYSLACYRLYLVA